MEGLPNDNMVQIIRLSHNNFEKADFLRSKSLKELYLNHNLIKELEIKGNYPSLQKLDLVGNQIARLDFSKLLLPSLSTLDLRT